MKDTGQKETKSHVSFGEHGTLVSEFINGVIRHSSLDRSFWL
jgi:hypothetical protein